MSEARRIGLVVHPSRDVSEPRAILDAWAEEHGAEVVPLEVGARDCKGCDVVVALGGDGTVLGGIRAAEAGEALRRFAAGDWRARKLEALWVRAEDGTEFRAINDVVVVRKGAGQ